MRGVRHPGRKRSSPTGEGVGSGEGLPAVDLQVLARHVAGRVGDQEGNRRGVVLGGREPSEGIPIRCFSRLPRRIASRIASGSS